MRIARSALVFWCVLGYCVLAFAQTSGLVSQVKLLALSGDLSTARAGLKQFRDARGVTPEYLEALSWIGRAELSARNYPAAESNAAEVRKLCLAQIARRKFDAEPSLPLALGASIEVQAQAATAQGRRDEAVLFLRAELARWRETSIRARIQKNLNLLTLEGKPAPALQLAPLEAHRGHPVLLFFWAHWCSDCKNEIAVVQKIESLYASRGLVVIAPTQHYGYVAGGQDADREKETKYIREVFAQYYAVLGHIATPLNEENFARYGVSTTPTLVLVDGGGIVRLYNPGNIGLEALSAKIEPLLHH